MLFLDIGNSRVKYRTGGGPVVAVPHDGDPRAAVARAADGADRIAAVDVTGTVAGALPGRGVLVLTPSPAACGVVNAYPDPARLGADRWAALIGARSLTPRACCVIDAGSAITADVLAADGRHLGGWIAPGVGLAIAALARGTRNARADAPGATAAAPATNTADAIQGGALHALVGFAERARRAAADAVGMEPELLVCGGDAALVAAALPAATVVDDLVLRGLAVWADGR